MVMGPKLVSAPLVGEIQDKAAFGDVPNEEGAKAIAKFPCGSDSIPKGRKCLSKAEPASSWEGGGDYPNGVQGRFCITLVMKKNFQIC